MKEYGLYANPAARMGRDKFHALLREGIVTDPPENCGPLYLLGWAMAAQHYGKLTPSLRARALEAIPEDASWGPLLAEKLQSPPGKPVTTLKPKRDIPRDPWERGDVYALRLKAGGYLAVQKVGTVGSFMRIAVFDKLFSKKPTLSALKELRYLPFANPEPFHPLPRSIPLVTRAWDAYPGERLTKLGNLPVGEIREREAERLSWPRLEILAPQYIALWEGEEYFPVHGDAYHIKPVPPEYL